MKMIIYIVTVTGAEVSMETKAFPTKRDAYIWVGKYCQQLEGVTQICIDCWEGIYKNTKSRVEIAVHESEFEFPL